VFDTVTALMTHTEQAKKCINSCPFIISELEIAEFLDEVVDTL
jgi:hypothetical protein